MIYGLIGEKLGHSYSKEIHSALGMENYELYELDADQVEGFVKQPEVKGLNVTIPYKQTVMPFCDTISENALRIGCVNTLVRDDMGKLRGHNTDYDGFVYMLKRAGISVSGKKVLILGTGGTSLTARTAVRDLGAREIVIASRRPAGAGAGNGTVCVHGPQDGQKPGTGHGSEDGQEPASGQKPGTGHEQSTGRRSADSCILRTASYDSLTALHADSEIIINTTPVGMYPNTPAGLISLSDFPKCGGVADVIYNPRRTKLVHEAEERGIPATDGLPMLVTQAWAAEKLFTGRDIAEEKLEDTIGKLRASRDNIVIIGMPGSGKTTVGAEIARLLGREFVDIDAAVEARAGRSIPDIFAEDGEDAFRRLEAEMIAEQGKRNGIVIATGGGAVKSEENYLPLSQNGRIYCVERRLEELSTDGRPLSAGLSALREMYAQRLPLYRRFADEIVQNEGTAEETARRIMEMFEGRKYKEPRF